MRILVVEDEIRIRKGMSRLIEGHTQHTVVGEASNGQEGIEMALLYAPDLIITDIRMPVMDGLEMMHQLREKDGDWHFVILSGYSEFEYAKKAIQYGADDYLIKPLAPDDVIKLLDSIEERLKKARKKKQEKPERLLRNYLIEKEDINTEQICEVCGFKEDEKLWIISAYVGNLSQEDRNACEERMEKCKAAYSDQKIYYFFTESTREFIVVMQAEVWESIKKELENKLLSRKAAGRMWIWTASEINGVCNLRDTYMNLIQMYEYALVINTGKILDEQSISDYEAEEFTYPQKSRKKIQDAFYKKEKQQFEAEIDIFAQRTGAAKVKPSKMRDEYMQMAYFLLNLAKENDSRIYEMLQNLNVTQNIGNAVTYSELHSVFAHMVQVMADNMEEQQNISNFVILRAIDFIRNHYNESISLDMIASNRDITPEYLSTLFNREVGENFSSFLKKFRISHAKRLLKDTDKKIYEIAETVGYSDSKYFNRVFKEVEGISPGDFRSLNS